MPLGTDLEPISRFLDFQIRTCQMCGSSEWSAAFKIHVFCNAQNGFRKNRLMLEFGVQLMNH
eukprot:13348143-Alexandrium_andersonii.AAC.1